MGVLRFTCLRPRKGRVGLRLKACTETGIRKRRTLCVRRIQGFCVNDCELSEGMTFQTNPPTGDYLSHNCRLQ